MRILFVNETSGPGGAEQTVLNLAEAMAQRGHHCVVAVPASGWVSESAAARGLPWELTTPQRRSTWRQSIAGVRRLIKRHNSELVHAHMLSAAIYSGVAARLCRVPCVATIHGAGDIQGGRRARQAKFALLRLFTRGVAIVSGELLQRVVTEYPVIRPKAHLIHNGIPVPEQAPPAQEPRPAGDRPFTFGALGNIRKPKGYGYLLEAAAAVRRDYPDTRWLVAGQPDKAGLYEELIARRTGLGLEEHVEFLGHVADVPGFFRQLDCLVSSSTSEGMPLSLIEAMAHEVPIIATRCGGVPELIEHDRHGILCAPADTGALTTAMNRVRQHPEQLRAMAQDAARRAREEFSLEAMCDAYERLYAAAPGGPGFKRASPDR